MGIVGNVKDKASSAIETSKLNSKISSEQNAIDAVMKQIGEFYFKKYAETKTADEGIAGFCKTIDGHNAAIAEAKAEIERIKAKTAPPPAAPAASGGTVCTVCGKENLPGAKFCTECGGKTAVPAAPAASGGTVCPACGKENLPGAKFCTECGGKTAAPAAPAASGGTVCTACGKENPPGTKFCTGCGGKLEASKRVCACGAELAPGIKFCTACGAKV
jgi:uncharacterized OB-fold protein